MLPSPHTNDVVSMHLVALHGDIDILQRESIDEALAPIREYGPNTVTVLDLSDVSYVDSTLFNALAKLRKFLQVQYPSSSICVVAKKEIQRLFHLMGMDRVFPLFDDVFSAQQSAFVGYLNRQTSEEALRN